MMGLIDDLTATMRQRSRLTTVSVVALSIVALFFLFPRQNTSYFSLASPSRGSSSSFNLKTNEKLYGKDYEGRSNPDINRVTNDTLGFSKIFVVGLPERSDKRDAIALTSALTGFHVDFVDGVRGQTIPDKAVPFGVDRKALLENNLGSWRGHMNVIRRIVEEDLDSALIMEDDMDWDVRLRAQLEQVATGARAILSNKHSPGSSLKSPYGDDWDLLWLGHCGEVFPETLDENKNKPPNQLDRIQHKFTIKNDPTVPPPDAITGFQDFKSNPYTRWVHITGAPICTFAYALSQQGARKVLLDLSVDHLLGAFDNALASLCRRAVTAASDLNPSGDRGLDIKCISVTPPVFFHHKAKGTIGGDSDIQTVGEDGVRELGTTENIMWSARNNIRNMIMGTEMESQFRERGSRYG